MKKKFILFSMCLLLLSSMIIPLYASDFNMKNDIYTKLSENKISEINSLIEEISLLKAKIFDYENNKDESDKYSSILTDNEYYILKSELDNKKNMLEQLGAVPTSEVLQSIEIDSSEYNEPNTPESNEMANLINDFYAFEQTYGYAYDLWGIYHTVHAAYGSFDVYEIIIQDNVPNGNLSSQTYFGTDSMGNPVYYTTVYPSPYISNLPNLLNALIPLGVSAISANMPPPYGQILSMGYELFSTLHGVYNALNPTYETLSTGANDIYTIGGTAFTTVRFLYVRPYGINQGNWEHTYTVNTVNISEIHNVTYTVSSVGGYYQMPSTQAVYRSIQPDNFIYRLTTAIQTWLYEGGNYKYDCFDYYRINAQINNQSYPLITFPIKYVVREWDLWA